MTEHSVTNLIPVVKHVADAAAGLVGVGALVGMLPQIAAALTIVWYIIRVYEYLKDKYGKKSGG